MISVHLYVKVLIMSYASYILYSNDNLSSQIQMKEQFGFPNTICDKPSMQIISSHSICHTLCLN